MRETEPSFANSGWQLYERAKQLIPGGTQLLSKRPELYLPQGWPCYYEKAKGCEIWDCDGRHFIDMTTSGIGACVLGYADPDVNEAVKKCIDVGSMTTLMVPAEVELAERLCDVHPWAKMARYTRTGGEAMSVAVRIARAFTGRSKVAVCGYHGWSDWYLAANLATDQSLDGHLLPGLRPTGVPRELAGTVRTFRYNQIDELAAIVNDHDHELAAIVMEPMRSAAPAPGFLQNVRDIADRIGAVLIFDEITSAWRHAWGGLHLKLGVDPDIAVFAKSLSNGFPMAAIVGTAEVMQAAQSSFISSSYWTEAIGPTAAIATLDKMAKIDASALCNAAGAFVQQLWRDLAVKHNLDVTISGYPALCSFAIKAGSDTKAIQTLFTQQMLDRGFLANATFYPTATHSRSVLDRYAEAIDESLREIRTALTAGDVLSRLRGPVAIEGFSRLT